MRARVPIVIKAFPAGDRAIARFEEFGADYLLVDGDNPGSGQVFDWRLAEGVADHHRLIVSGGLRPDNVADAVAHLRPGRGRRVHRRRVGAGPQGPAARCATSSPTRAAADADGRVARPAGGPGRPRSPTTGGTGERRRA